MCCACLPHHIGQPSARKGEVAMRSVSWSARRVLVIVAVSIGLIFVTNFGRPAEVRADDPVPAATIVCVEEDWELVVGEPDSENVAPQITCVFSPIGSAGALYAALDLNHHSQPSFDGGGAQLQVWANDVPIATVDSGSHAKLHQDDEHVTWTQRMSLEGGALTFAVVNVQADTWGGFAENENLSITVGTTLSSLSTYSPEVSVLNSGIGFAANRVKSLKIYKVRYSTGDGLVIEDATDHVVYQRE
jgi:hypothetical protein